MFLFLFLAAATPLGDGWDEVEANLSKNYGASLDAVAMLELQGIAVGADPGVAPVGFLDVTLTVDISRDFGTSVAVRGLGVWGAAITPRVGDVQGISNIEAPSGLQLYEAWIEQEVFDGGLSVRAGIIDQNVEMTVLDGAALFMHSTSGIGPEISLAGQSGPTTYPASGLGLRVKLEREGTYATVAVTDGAPSVSMRDKFDLSSDEGVHTMAELGVELGSAALSVGGWTFTRPATAGVYAMFEFLSDLVDVFARVGWSNGGSGPVDGLVAAGALLHMAALHDLGLFSAVATRNDAVVDGLRDLEIAHELTYRFRLLGRVSLQASLQWVMWTGFLADHALVGGARVFAEF